MRDDKKISRIRRKFRSAPTIKTEKGGEFNHRNEAYLWNSYLKGLMKKLSNAARQELFRMKPERKPCLDCGYHDTIAFYLDYLKPEVVWFCQVHHKEHSQKRGSIFDQLDRHGLKPISWEQWKDGVRPDATPRTNKKG